MENSFWKQAADFLKNQKNARRWLILFLCLAVAVTTGTLAALRLNGQAMTKKSLTCSYEVHKHTDDCYEKVDGEKILMCGYADYVVHKHTTECYDENDNLVCKLPEVEAHKHTADCYKTERVLTCGQKEAEGHKHTDDCYKTEKTLTCGKEESEGHTHGDGCYDEEGNLICNIEESEGHTHSDDCYKEEKTLVCGKEESEGHTHSDDCYSEEKVAVCGKLELHTHTDKCFEKPEDAEDKDGDGKADGRPICGIPELKEHQHDESCFTDINGKADDGKDGPFTTTAADPEPEGNSTEAASADENAAAGNLQKVYEDANIKVTASYDESAGIPENAELKAEQITAESDSAHFAEREAQMQKQVGDENVEMKMLLKIGFYVDGREIEPKSPVQITMQLMKDGFAVGDPVTVVHFGDEETETIQGTDVTEDGEGNLTTSFQTDSFSEFGIANIDLPKSIAFSEDLSDYIVSQKLSKNGEDLDPGGQVVIGDNYVYSVEFSPDARGESSFSSPMTFYLGSGAKCEPGDNLPLMQDGHQVGTYSVTADGHVTVTFDDAFLKQTDQKLKMQFAMQVKKANDGQGKQYPWDGDESLHYVVDYGTEIDVKKNANYYSTSSNVIYYTVEATVKNGILKDGYLRDVMKTTGVAYQEGSAEVRILDADGKDITSTFDNLPEVKKTDDGWELRGLPELTEGQKVVVTYKADVPESAKEGNPRLVENDVEFGGKLPSDADVPPKTAHAEKDTFKDQLEKTGEVDENNQILWHVKIGNGWVDPRGCEVTDTLIGGGQTFADEDLTVNIYDKDGNVKKTYTIPKGTVSADGSEMKYTLPQNQPAASEYTWQQGDYFEVTYHTNYDLSKQPEQGFKNEVRTTIKDAELDSTAQVPIGDGVRKTVADNEQQQYLTYTVEVDVPSADKMTKMGKSEDDHTGLPYFYIQDKLRFENMYINNSQSEEDFFAKNVPKNVRIHVSGTEENGTPHSFDFTEYPYAESVGLGPNYSNTFQIIQGTESSSDTGGNDICGFVIYFNTANYGIGTDGKLDHHDSIWDINYPTTMTITYNIPYDTLIVDENGNQVYKQSVDGTMSKEPMTVGDLLAQGEKLSNKAYEVRRGVEKSDEKYYQKLPEEGEIEKSNMLLKDGVIEYRVKFDNYRSDTKGRIIKHDEAPYYSDVVFEDTFDERLEYVPGSFYVEVRSRSSGRLYASFQYNGTGPLVPGNPNKITATVADFSELIVNDGKDHTDYTELADSFSSAKVYVFVYKLQLKEEFRNDGNDYLDLKNTANLNYGGKGHTDTSVVDIPAKHLEKDVVFDQEHGTATYTIELNPAEINLVQGIIDDDGNTYDPTNYEMVDTMSDNQSLVPATETAPNPIVQYWNGKDWVTATRTTDPTLVQPKPADEQSWTPYYYQTVHPDNKNGMSFTLPDNTSIKIVYTVTISGEPGTKVPITNEAKLTAKVEVADIEDTEYEIGSNSAIAEGKSKTTLIKYQTGTENQVPGAKFAYYSESKPESYPSVPNGVEKTLTVTKGEKEVTLHLWKVYETDTYGYIPEIDAQNNESGEGLYALVEYEAPEGYILNDEPIFFQFAKTDPKVVQVNKVTMDNSGTAKEYEVQHPGTNGSIKAYNAVGTYELPETGGIGTMKSYAVGVLLALAAVGALAYTTQKRRKEGN